MNEIKIGAIQDFSKERKLQEKTCRMFESYFLFLLLKEMEKIKPIDKKKDFSKDTYMSIVHEKLADYLAQRGVGIKQMLLDSFKFYEKKSDNKDKG